MLKLLQNGQMYVLNRFIVLVDIVNLSILSSYKLILACSSYFEDHKITLLYVYM
jgi:hypothetical protein